MRLGELLARGRPVLADGAMGTMLQDAGLEDGGPGELWNVERPEAIAAIHRDYAEAGARLITTNTFGGTRPRLDLHGLGDRVAELSTAGAAIARAIADEHGAIVAGNVGPTGELLEPLGTLSAEAAQDVFAEQIGALVAGGADVILIETMSDLGEVTAAVAAARAVAPGVEVVATLSFDTNLHTMMGVSPAAAVAALEALGVAGAGANCGRGPGEIEAAMRSMAAARSNGVALVAQSNAGLPRLVGDAFRYDGTPAVMAAYARQMRELGVDVIGACCGSTPAHVAAMAAALAA
jgi:5-methyltetrahydrofolate--homocysteine methyltransferase